MGLHLGVPLCSPHCVQCRQHVDSSGTHGLHCRKSLGRPPHHASLNELVKRALTTIEVPSIVEPVGLCRSDRKQPDGMSIVPWKKGRALVWDVTVWDIFAPFYSGLAAGEAGSVANLAEAAKRRLYSELTVTHHFVPIGIDSLGVFLVIQPGLSLKNWDIAQEHSPEIHSHTTNFTNGSV